MTPATQSPPPGLREIAAWDDLGRRIPCEVTYPGRRGIGTVVFRHGDFEMPAAFVIGAVRRVR